MDELTEKERTGTRSVRVIGSVARPSAGADFGVEKAARRQKYWCDFRAKSLTKPNARGPATTGANAKQRASLPRRITPSSICAAVACANSPAPVRRMRSS